MLERIYEAKEMTTKRKTKFIHEGKYVAEVDVELIVDVTE
jgi:hypothetical protein